MKRRIFFGLIFILLLFIVVELLARAYYYKRPARSALASYELLRSVKRAIFKQSKKVIPNSIHYLVRTNVSKEVNDSIAAENSRANYSIYQPWVGFRFGNIHGKYVNAFDQVRKSVPDVSGPGENPIVIWFLGGSTMFGYNATDAETIPSSFTRAYQKKANQRPIRVVNYGTPFYYSYQELIQLSDNLYKGNRPDIVIMLDGLNECAAPMASYLRNPYDAPRMQQMLNPELYHYSEGYDYYHLPDSNKIGEVSQAIYQNYIENIENARKLAQQFNFKLYCFWQPVPFYNYPGKSEDPICAKSTLKQFDLVYPLVIKKAAEVDYLFSLADMLVGAKLPFVDSGHYSPWMNEAIGKRMLDSIDLK